LLVHLRSFIKFKLYFFENYDVVFLDKMISNKKLSTIKLYNFLESTTFIWLFLQILNLKNSNVFFNKINSNKKVVIYKVLDLFEIYNFYFYYLVICSFDIVIVTLFTNSIYPS
jgi:hypothetical protein